MNIENPFLLNILMFTLVSLCYLLYIKKISVFLKGIILGIIPMTFVYVMFQEEMSTIYLLIYITRLQPLLEEVVKISPLFLLNKENMGKRDLIFYGGLFGLYFGVTENWTYLKLTGILNIYRLLLSTPMHMFTSSLSSYGIWRYQTDKNIHWVIFLLCSIALHIIYNFLV